jgi:hypothetical protein
MCHPRIWASIWRSDLVDQGGPVHGEEDNYPYAQRDIVDDIVHEEDFQNVNDDNKS